MKEEELLEYLIKPKTIYQICAEFNKGYTTVYHSLNILKEKGIVNKHKAPTKTVWFKIGEKE